MPRLFGTEKHWITLNPDSRNLRILADYFDKRDKRMGTGSDETQRWLRDLANRIEQNPV